MKKQLVIALIALTIMPQILATSASSSISEQRKRVRITLDGNTIPQTDAEPASLMLRNVETDETLTTDDESDGSTIVSVYDEAMSSSPVARSAERAPGFIGSPELTKLILLTLKTDYPGLCKLAPISTGFDALKREMLMPTGKEWVAWVKGLLVSGKKNERIFDEINAACLRHPNALRELQAIAKSYFTDVPESLRLYNWDEATQTIQTIAEKDALRTQLQKAHERMNNVNNGATLQRAIGDQERLLTQLIPCAQAIQPYHIASCICNGIFRTGELYLTSIQEAGIIEWLRNTDQRFGKNILPL